ncbi:MAG: hypothetical protein E6Q97_19335 [Desulfurellales bacterium]|nr:MAG: hypothetical protein E6Q97_19335 [Desulfurellales bacterium]
MTPDSHSHSHLPHLIPAPASHTTMARWEHTRLRRRMLGGEWREDLERRLLLQIGTVRKDAWGVAATTSNPFSQICREQSALYSREPVVRAPKGDVIYGVLADAIRDSGLWSKAQEFQAHVVGLRESFWRVDVSPTGSVSYRPVWPDLVEARSDAARADQPVAIRELRWRDQWGWTWDHLSILGEGAPFYKIERYGTDSDITVDILGESYSGDSYPYRYSDGVPFLPYVIYHARSLGDRLWHERDLLETVEASLDLAVYQTMLNHVFTDGSWPQRYMMGCSPSGGDTSADGSRREIIADPAVVLQLSHDPSFTGQPIIGQWQASASPRELEEVISSIANRVAIDAGLPPADIQRMGGTARSGYAIALSNEGKRQAARRFAPSFRASDEELVGKTAALLNRAQGLGLPEFGYSVQYVDLPLSPEELRSRREHALALLQAGLLSRVDAYMELNPGLTRAQAQLDLAEIDAQSARLPLPPSSLQ